MKTKKSLGLKNEYVFARAKKALGQNFLKSEIAIRKIIEAGEIKKDDIILEIGPGKGALTKQLLACSCQLIAIEKDNDLYELLKMKFEKEILSGQLKLVCDDILKFNSESYRLKARNYKLIANIPYNITGAIFKKFLTEENQPESMILMIQHEVAQRIIGNSPFSAKAMAGKKESILSISVKAYGEPKMIMKVDKRYFSPMPKVNSAVIAIKNISRKNFYSPLEECPLGGGGINLSTPSCKQATPQEGNRVDEGKFWEIVKAGFAHKRKKLSSNLKDICQRDTLTSLGNKRAEDLKLADWIALTKGV